MGESYSMQTPKKVSTHSSVVQWLALSPHNHEVSAGSTEMGGQSLSVRVSGVGSGCQVLGPGSWVCVGVMRGVSHTKRSIATYLSFMAFPFPRPSSHSSSCIPPSKRFRDSYWLGIASPARDQTMTKSTHTKHTHPS